MRGIKNSYTRSTDLYGAEKHRHARDEFYDTLHKEIDKIAEVENWSDDAVYIRKDQADSFYERIESEMLDWFWEDEFSDRSYLGRKKFAQEILEALWSKHEEAQYE